MYEINIKKDGDGFIREVNGVDNIYAYLNTKSEAKKELILVIEMMTDYYLENVEKNRVIKNKLLEYSI